MDRLHDAVKLLDAAKPTEYSMGASEGGLPWARVRIGNAFGEASNRCLATAVCHAIAKALRIGGNTN
jgi:hypothetical protein